jgi:ABC-type phosphate/phosphonate transport system substrate-binding protein
MPLRNNLSSMMMLASGKLGVGSVEAIKKAFESFPKTREGEAFFRQSGYGGYSPIRPEDLKAMQPYAKTTQALLLQRPD